MYLEKIHAFTGILVVHSKKKNLNDRRGGHDLIRFYASELFII